MPDPQQQATPLDPDAIAKQLGGTVSTGQQATGDTSTPPARTWLDSVVDFADEATKGIRGIPSALAHPIDTVTNSLSAQGDVAKKAEASFKSGDYAQGVRHVINYLIPFLGPRLDQAGDYMQEGQYAKGLGATTDVATGVAVPALLKTAGAAAPAVEAASDTKLAESMIPSRGANRMEALDTARRVAPTMNDQGVTAFTQQGLSNAVDTKLAAAGRGIDQAEATVPKTVVFGQNDIVGRLQALKKQLTVTGSSGTVAPTGYKMASDALDKAIDEVKQTGTISIENITKFRRAWQATAADMRAYVNNPTKDITSQGASIAAGAWADAADALNDVVETKAPQLGPAYQQWGTYRNAQKVLQAAQDAEVLRKTSATGTGGILGRFFDAAVQSRLPTLTQSKLYSAIASAIKNGNGNAAVGAITSLGRSANVSQDQIQQAIDAALAASGGSKQ